MSSSTSTTKRKSTTTSTPPSKKPRTISSFFPSSSTTPSTSTPTPKFDKTKWLSTLPPETRTLLTLETTTMHDSWLSVLKDDLTTPEFLSLKRFLQREREQSKKIYPPEPDIYSWSRHTPLDSVKVVILGQDPYHGPNQAHGLSFSVRPPTRAPPSLKNMYVALKKDYPSFTPPPSNGGLLTPWATRGVLLLNACLTVRASEPNSHSGKGWERLTQRVIDVVAQKRGGGVVFMAWGSPAAKRVAKVDRKRHLVLTAVHPSPLSASKGFFDCGHFRKANGWLVERYGDRAEIEWSLDPASTTVEKKVPVSVVEDASPSDKEVADMDEEKEKENEAPKTKKPKARDSIGEVEFDAEEEEALVQATLQAEQDLASA